MLNTVVLRDARTGRWLRFRDPQVVVSATDLDEVLPRLRLVERMIDEEGLYAAGFVAYEAAAAFDSVLKVKENEQFPLLWFGLYTNPEEIELGSLPTERLPEDMPWKPSITPTHYHRAIERVRHHIEIGDTYQVNFTFRLNALFNADPWRVFAGLVDAHDPPYGAFVSTEDWTICSVSPELFFDLNGDELVSRPMKGTAARGMTHEDDLRQADDLRHSEKNRAENLMIVDMVRNDLGRVAAVDTVKVHHLFATERYRTLWQMTSTVAATTHAPLTDVFEALFPPASITGAPKARTMEIITELETTPRGVYTGCVGFAGPGRRAQFNVAIRTLVIDKRTRRAEYGVGGGIVWDSTPEMEWDECSTKARVLSAETDRFSILETMLWTPQDGCCLLEQHLQRMGKTAEYFAFPFDVDTLRRQLAALAPGLPPVQHKIRALLAKDGRFTCQAEPLAVPVQTGPGNVCLASSPIDSEDPFLYHKTTNRTVYEDARRACPGYDDVILWNERNEITESTIANVVAEIDGMLCTPPVRSGLLPGVHRAWMLEEGMVTERILTVAELLRSPHIYLVNSVRGRREVTVRHQPLGTTTSETDPAH